ncbi:MAG TPA: hypothetical protein VLF20_05430 [Patescibacteria group bacterium]|nr:hypothetical protein [Patescibacteria group bacterium]
MAESFVRRMITVRSKEQLVRPPYTVVSTRGSGMFWQQKGSEIVRVMAGGSADFLTYDRLKEEHSRLASELSDWQTRIFLLRNDVGSLVGFTYAVPAYRDDRSIQYLRDNVFAGTGMTNQEILERQSRTALIGWTMILPTERGKGGWSMMMDVLDQQLAESGQYDEMERIVRHAGDYSAKIKKRYEGRIVYEDPFYSIYYGPQAYFRVKL